MFDGLGVRLCAPDLAVLGRYLFGPRWKAALARELEVSVRIVGYWASAERPTSVRCSAAIIALVQRRRADRLRQVQQGYAAMVCALHVPLAALAITVEVVPPYPVPASTTRTIEKPREPPATPQQTVAERYEGLGFVAIAAALRAA